MEAMTFVLFGATGDLAKRKIFPALYNLFLNQKLPLSISIIGVGRGDLSDTDFQTHVEDSLKTFSRRSLNDDSKLEVFIRAFRYSHVDVSRLKDIKDYLNSLNNVKKN